MGSIKVSIIVPIYNVEKYLDRCMQSLLGQTLKDIEIIMVDDGSPDGCPALCDEYVRRDARVKVIHKQNAGLGYARNAGLDVATGEYVAFVDSDDYVDLEMYEKLYVTAIRTGSDVVYCGFNRYYSENNVIHYANVNSEHVYKGEDVNQLLLDFISSSPKCKKDWKYEMSVWHSIYKREVIKENNIKFYSERDYLSEDIPFQVDFLKAANSASYIPDTLYYYCMNNAFSLTRSKYSSDKLERSVALYNLLARKTKDIDKECLRAKRFFISYMRAHLYGISAMDIPYNEKIRLMKELNDKKIWETVDSYPYSALNKNSRLICFLQRNRMYATALFYVKIILFIKSILHK